MRPPSQRDSIEYLKSLKGRRFGGYKMEIHGVNLNEKKSTSFLRMVSCLKNLFSNIFLENVLRRRALNRQRIVAKKCIEILKSGTRKGYTYSECMVSSSSLINFLLSHRRAINVANLPKTNLNSSTSECLKSFNKSRNFLLSNLEKSKPKKLTTNSRAAGSHRMTNNDGYVRNSK